MHSQIQIEISLCIGACQRKQKSRYLHCFSSLSFVFFTWIKEKFPWSRISWNGTLLFRLSNTDNLSKEHKKREGRDIFFPNFYWINATTGQWSVNYTHWKNTFLYLVDKHLSKYCASYFQTCLLIILRWEVNAAVAIDVSCRL